MIKSQVHKLCQASAEHILNEFQPNLMIAIGGGGYVPARILRYLTSAPIASLFLSALDAIPLTTYSSFLKRPSSPNIPIQAIGLSLYESLPSRGDPSEPVEVPGTKVTRTQWLDLSTLEMSSLVGKNILIVDEVDDTRTTLEYAVKELQKDVEAARRNMPGGGGDTRFSIFVLHVGFRSTRLSCSLLIYTVSFHSGFFPPPSSLLVILWTPTRMIREHQPCVQTSLADGVSANSDRTKISPKKAISPQT